MGVETRILILSSRDQVSENPDEPPLEGRADAGSPRRAVPLDSVAPVAAHVLAALVAAPGLCVMHRAVFQSSEVHAAVGDHRPDVVFNLCEALDGDSRLEVHAAWLLERLGLPFTGSSHRALRRCLYKLEANQLLARAGVRVPATIRADSPDHLPKVAFPAIVKPEREDGSNGISKSSVVHDRRSLRDQVAEVIATYKQPAVVQRYVHGRELSISFLGWPEPRALPPGEILFHGLPEGHPHILTFDAKWRDDSGGGVGTPSVAAVLRPSELRRVTAIGRRTFEVLGLRDYGRVDLRLDERGDPYVIDVNPNCDLSPDGGFARAAGRAGLGYRDFLPEIVHSALRRHRNGGVLFASRGRAPSHRRAAVAASGGAP